MNASFRRGFDGWIYVTHGFNNNSTVKGRDGSEVKLNSGNTYRVRPDGSRVEQHTWGQVNPVRPDLRPARQSVFVRTATARRSINCCAARIIRASASRTTDSASRR